MFSCRWLSTIITNLPIPIGIIFFRSKNSQYGKQRASHLDETTTKMIHGAVQDPMEFRYTLDSSRPYYLYYIIVATQKLPCLINTDGKYATLDVPARGIRRLPCPYSGGPPRSTATEHEPDIPRHHHGIPMDH